MSGSQLAKALCKEIARPGKIAMAVAYWREGATARLGIENVSSEVRIICDAYSGACNPEELKRLMGLPHVQIRTIDSLHAKVYLTAQCAFVGSANASANGLGQEGSEVVNIEAAAMIADPVFTRSALRWFNDLWKAPKAKEVTDEDFEELFKLWKARRRNRPMSRNKSTSLLQAVKADPDSFKNRDLRLVAYIGVEPSQEEHDNFERVSSQLFELSDPEQYKSKNRSTFYVDNWAWNVSEGDYILEFTVNRKRTKAKFMGLWRVRSERAFHKTKSGARLILLDEVSNYKKLELSQSDSKELGNAIIPFLQQSGFKVDAGGNMLDLTLDEAVRVLKL